MTIRRKKEKAISQKVFVLLFLFTNQSVYATHLSGCKRSPGSFEGDVEGNEDEGSGMREAVDAGPASDIADAVLLLPLPAFCPTILSLRLSSISFLCSSRSSMLRWREAASTGVVGEGSPMMGASWLIFDAAEVGDDLFDDDDGPTERDTRCCLGCLDECPPLDPVDMATRSTSGRDSARRCVLDNETVVGEVMTNECLSRLSSSTDTDIARAPPSLSNETSRTALRAR